jgi:hypothetical protein
VSKKEEWRAVEGWPGYEVSNLGRVRSSWVHGVARHCNGPWKVLNLPTPNPGYPRATLCGNGRRRYVRVHVLVMELFVGPRPDRHEINHKDGNKTNNRTDNLEYVTCLENNRHAHRTGLNDDPPRKAGADNPKAIFTQRQVEWIRSRHKKGDISIAALAREVGASKSCIGSIVRYETYKAN